MISQNNRLRYVRVELSCCYFSLLDFEKSDVHFLFLFNFDFSIKLLSKIFLLSALYKYMFKASVDWATESWTTRKKNCGSDVSTLTAKTKLERFNWVEILICWKEFSCSTRRPPLRLCSRAKFEIDTKFYAVESFLFSQFSRFSGFLALERLKLHPKSSLLGITLTNWNFFSLEFPFVAQLSNDRKVVAALFRRNFFMDMSLEQTLIAISARWHEF